MGAHAGCAGGIRGAGFLKTGARAKMNAAATEKSMFVPRTLFFRISGLVKIVEGGVGLALDSLDAECQFRRVGQVRLRRAEPTVSTPD